MPSKDPDLRYEDIVDNIERIRQYTRGISEEDFYADPMRRDAVERCFQRISEAAVKLGEQAEEDAPDLPWADIRGLGNFLRHQYDQVDSRLIWTMIEKNIDPLDQAVRHVLAPPTRCQ